MPSLYVPGGGNPNFLKLKEKATVKKTSKAINTDWLAANIEPTNTPSVHRIQIVMATTSVVNILMDDGSNSNIQVSVNGGTALDAGVGFVFDFVVPAGYSYNLQHETGTQDVSCQIVEAGVLS